MKSVLRRHPVATVAAALVVGVVAGVALAPWWIDLAPVRAKVERTASSALGGVVAYERIDLSWFPHPEVVVRGLKVSVPGQALGTVRTVRVSPSLLPLLRGRVVITKIGVEGLDLALDLSSSVPKDLPEPSSGPDWTQTLRSLGSQTLDVELSRGRVVLSRPAGKSLTLEGIRLDASLRSADGKAGLTLTRLSANSPRLDVEGKLGADAGVPSLEAAAKGSALDITDVRAKLLSFAGDDAVIAEILAIVRGGTLTSFSFASSGRAPSDLGALERMSIRAVVKDGKVRVPGPNLDLVDVAADVALEGGALTAENAGARVGKSRAEGGKVLVGLAKGDDRLHVEALVKADLAEVPSILERVIPSRTFHEEVALVEGLAGSATGRLTIGDLKSAPVTSVVVSDMRFSANYRRLPWPLEVGKGRFFFDGTRVGVSGLDGGLGRSTFSGLAARVRLGRTPALEAASGAIVVSLEDFFEGIRTRPGAEALVKNVRRVSGSVFVDVQRLAGPLARLGEASPAASGTFKEILFDSASSSLPPLSIASGRFALADDAVRVADVDLRTMDAALHVSGVWNDYRKGAGTVEAVADGRLGAETVRWCWEKASLPAEFRPAAPVAVGGVRLSFAGGGALTAAGDLVVANGPRLTLDLALGGGVLDVRNLTIADGDARATLSARLEERLLDASFKGRLGAATLAKIFGERTWRGGAIEGDLAAHVPLDTPERLTADGSLTATNFEVPTPVGAVTLERLEARAAGSRLDVASSSLALDEQRVTISGSATLKDEAVVLDLDAATRDLAWTRVEKILGRVEEAKKKKETAAVQPAPGAQADGTRSKASSSAPLAIRGDLRVSLDSFTYGDFVFKPILGDIRFTKDAVAAAIRKADICGIATTGEARFLPGGVIAVDARGDAAGPDMNVPLTCLGTQNVGMTGSYEVGVKVKGEGPASDLTRALRGPLTFKAMKGQIGKATVLTRILGVLNATDVFAGKSGGRVGEAIPYDSITVDAELVDGRVSIREAAMKAPSITMAASGTIGLLDESLDLMVLSHPLSTLDKVVQAVPVVNTILGRNFLAVAVKVTGTVGDPEVTITPGRDVGKGLVGILERTVTLPVKVFDPPAPNPIP